MSRSQQLANFLLMYRITPHTSTGRSPAELFLKRQPRTRFNLIKPDLRSKIVDKQSPDVSTKFRQFECIDRVRVRSHRNGEEKWMPGTIVKRLGPLTYLVRVGEDVRHIHVDHLLRSGETISDHQPEYIT